MRRETRTFWEMVNVGPPESCWEWLGAHYDQRRGYGGVPPTLARELGERRAHRAAYRIWSMGPIPEGLHVCHSCDNPGCCNPEHLFLGTQKDNMQDALHKGRLPIGPSHNWYGKPKNLAWRKHQSSINSGEKHPRARLTVEQVLAIRKDGRPNKVVAQEYGIAPTTVYGIKHRLRWRSV